MSPRELYREFAAANARRRNEANRDARLAWTIVHIWASTKSKSKIPALDRYLVKAEPAASERTGEAAARRNLAALEVLSAQFGIPIRPGTGAGSHAK